MFKRNWLLHPPIGVGLAVVALLIGAGVSARYQKQANCTNGGASQHSQTAMCNVQNAPIAPVGGIKAPPRNPEPERDEWREEKDLEAQREMARWALLTAIAACLSVIVTTAGVIYVKQTLDATRGAVTAANRGNETMREMGQAQVRAYVVPTNVSVTLDGRCPVIHYSLHNSGNSPAFEVQVTGAAKMAVDAIPDWDRTNWRGRVSVILGAIRQGDVVESERGLHIGTSILSEEEVAQLPTASFLYLFAALTISYLDVFKESQSATYDFLAIMDKPHDGKRQGMAPNHSLRIGGVQLPRRTIYPDDD